MLDPVIRDILIGAAIPATIALLMVGLWLVVRHFDNKP